MVNYPSNSGKEPENAPKPEERKPVTPIVSGKVKVKKKNAVTKLADIFLPEDRASVKEYILSDVIVPYFKKIADDAFHMFLYGRGAGSSSTPKSNGLYYSDISRWEGNVSNVVSRRNGRYSANSVVFDTMQDAQKVLLMLKEEIKKYGVVTVLTYYELAAVPSNYTDDKYGWADLSSAEVVRVNDGYTLKLPRPIEID